jgi:hypothetical protein
MCEDYATGVVETRRAGRGGEGRDGHVRLEAATGRKAARRRRWTGVEEKGSGREREVVAIAADATDSMGPTERRARCCSRRGVRCFSSSAGAWEASFHFFSKERVRINGACWPHIFCSVSRFSQHFFVRPV